MDFSACADCHTVIVVFLNSANYPTVLLLCWHKPSLWHNSFYGCEKKEKKTNKNGVEEVHGGLIWRGM